MIADEEERVSVEAYMARTKIETEKAAIEQKKKNDADMEKRARNILKYAELEK